MREMFYCVKWNLRALGRNPRTGLTLLMGFLLCFLLTDKTAALSREFMTNIHVLEPFIWAFADGDSILFASLALMLLLGELPRLDAPASMLVFRTTRKRWVAAQMATAVAVSLSYTGLLLLAGMLFSLGNSIFGNEWSETATMLSFAPETFEVALKVMRKTVKLTTPYACALHISLLMGQYILLLCMLQLAFTLLKGRRLGMSAVLAVSLTGYILTPARLMTWLNLPSELAYHAGLLSAWLSPLSHATYIMHNFGYDQLPTVLQTHLIMGGISGVLAMVSLKAARRRDFSFSGGIGYEQ